MNKVFTGHRSWINCVGMSEGHVTVGSALGSLLGWDPQSTRLCPTLYLYTLLYRLYFILFARQRGEPMGRPPNVMSVQLHAFGASP